MFFIDLNINSLRFSLVSQSALGLGDELYILPTPKTPAIYCIVFRGNLNIYFPKSFLDKNALSSSLKLVPPIEIK